MALSLSDIYQTKHAKPPRILLHGAAMIGKSTFFSEAPNPIFIQSEDGLSGITTNAFPQSHSIEEVKQALLLLLNEQHDFKTVVIDTADWLEGLIKAKVCDENDVTQIEEVPFGRGGYGLMPYWDKIISMLDQLNKQKNMIVGVVCHSRLSPVNDPETETYDQWELKLWTNKKEDEGAGIKLKEWADIIGFAKTNTNVREKSTSTKTKRQYKAYNTNNENIMLLGNNPSAIAGNRYGLPPVVQLRWQALMDAMQAAEQNKRAS